MDADEDAETLQKDRQSDISMQPSTMERQCSVDHHHPAFKNLSVLHQPTSKPTQPVHNNTETKYKVLEMWANAQPDGRPAEYRWRPLFNAAKFG